MNAQIETVCNECKQALELLSDTDGDTLTALYVRSTTHTLKPICGRAWLAQTARNIRAQYGRRAIIPARRLAGRVGVKCG